MPLDAAGGLTAEEQDILQELLNVAFGTASAALADRLGDQVVLSVPNVQVMPAVLLRYYVGAELKDQHAITLVEQAFEGELRGIASLVLPTAAGEVLLPLAGREGPPAERGRNALGQAGTLLIGACLARLGELLGTTIRCAPPTVTVDAQRTAALRADASGPEHSAVVLRTTFDLGREDLRGHLFVAAGHESIQWLKPALHRFMGQYA